ncbi:hypothetical protein [Protaetiibacter mangrovi]|uniref:Uncharacterized protein n=1 Tax=Protaetiibacter mangrovi TaxID=2970926 RepID=A0ABT1ZE36_9MICO|nr:hypothetical protein [Protaetiibacter mangrovi]MCS0498965.1 hypothetical protein [Protaetiibacter mangrovi]
MSRVPEIEHPREPSYDTFADIPDYASLRAAVDAGDWRGLEVGLDSLPADEATYAMTLLAEVAGIEAVLEIEHAAHAESAHIATLLAMRRTVQAWEARTRRQSADVEPERFAAFLSLLRESEIMLIAVCGAHPNFAPAWAARITNARGLQLGASEMRRRARRHADLSPHDLTAQGAQLQYLLPKWFGTDDDAAAFARGCAAAAPEGSTAPAIVAVYHLERWLETGGRAAGTAYLSRPEVLAELRASAARSVLHVAYRPTPLGVVAHSAFLMAFWLAGAHADAAVHVRALDGRASEFPWRYAIDEPSELGRIRAEILSQETAARR